MADAEKRYASKDDLGTDDEFEEVELPVLGALVRVRYLSTPEITRLQFLPDLFGFVQLVAKLQSQKPQPEDENIDTGVMLAESYKYQAQVAHMAVLDPEATEPEVVCPSCEFVHTPSLWTPNQTARLNTSDLDAITVVALKTQSAMVRSVRPFFTGPMPPGSSAPVAPGESIQPTSS